MSTDRATTSGHPDPDVRHGQEDASSARHDTSHPREDAARPHEDEGSARAVLYAEQVEPEYGILGLTMRELVMTAAWLVAFIVSFLPASPGGESVWTSGISWILTIGAPTVAVFLVVLRRFSPDGIRRVGSLGIDQFASVSATVGALAWAQLLWAQIAASIDTGMLLVGWVSVVALLALLVMVAATVAAPLIPRWRDDFRGRMETLAHRNANPVRPVIRRPRAEPASAAAADQAQPEEASVSSPAADDADDHRAPDAAVATAFEPATRTADAVPSPTADDAVTSEITTARPAPAPAYGAAAAEGAPAGSRRPVQQDVQHTDPIDALRRIFGEEEFPETSDAGLERGATDSEPFWVLAPTERDVLDERGEPLFRIGPLAWALVIEDRGGAYVMRHEDGRIGYLHDIDDVTRG